MGLNDNDVKWVYQFTYPVETWVRQRFSKHNNKNVSFEEFLLVFTENLVLSGFRKHHEEEQQWQVLRHDLYKERWEYSKSGVLDHARIYKLIDSVLILTHEGFDIPNLLL